MKSMFFDQRPWRGGLAYVWKTNFHGQPSAAKLWRQQPHLAPDQESRDRAALLATSIYREGLWNRRISMPGGGHVAGGAWAFTDACTALCHVHGMLVAHGDVKAQNIPLSLSPPGMFKLIDLDAGIEDQDSDAKNPRHF